MGSAKTQLFTQQQNQIASLAKVLGHPARVTIIQHLAKVKGCVCGDLVDEVGLAQATVSQHLKELKTMGIIKGTIEGNSVCYCIHEENWSKMKRIFIDFLEQSFEPSSSC